MARCPLLGLVQCPARTIGSRAPSPVKQSREIHLSATAQASPKVGKGRALSQPARCLRLLQPPVRLLLPGAAGVLLRVRAPVRVLPAGLPARAPAMAAARWAQ